MIKKEINEIKGLYRDLQDCGISRLAGCYVNGEKEKVQTFSESFLNLPDEELYKYLDIFRKTLSGTPGRNLFDMEFPLSETPTDGQRLLLALRDSELKDENLLNLFYDELIKNYDHTGNYLILLVSQTYDVPAVRLDGTTDEEGSSEIYRYILLSICPMNLTKPGLGFDDSLQEIHTLKRSFFVDLPDTGFLFPAFNNRSADVNALLYYTRKTDALQEKLLGNFLNVSSPIPARQQKEGFTEFVANMLGEDSDIDTVITLQRDLNEHFQEKKAEAEGEPVFLEKAELKELFERSGIPGEKLQSFDSRYDAQFERENVLKKLHKKTEERPEEDADEESLVYQDPEEDSFSPIRIDDKLLAENIAPVRSFEVKSPEMTLRISSKHLDILETRIIDGRKCLVIELTNDLKVNGVPVS